MLSFLHSFFTLKAYLPQFLIGKLLLNPAHDTYTFYEYCGWEKIMPFTILKPEHTKHFTYNNDFTIDENGVPNL